MYIIDKLKNIFTTTKKINIEKIPTQGIFYPKDFEISIKKASAEDILEYESTYNKDNIHSIISSIKKITSKNIILNKNYKFEDVKSVDILFLLMEIVKFTYNKKIELSYFNDTTGYSNFIEFSSKNFDYFDFSKYNYDDSSREILIDDYKFSLPSIGIENCLTNFLSTKSNDVDYMKWNNYNYDFLFFVNNKNNLNYSEIENLVTIFNYELDEVEKNKIKNIINIFKDIVAYKLKVDNKEVNISNKLNLQNIWKK
jgi:hypothetical protein